MHQELDAVDILESVRSRLRRIFFWLVLRNFLESTFAIQSGELGNLTVVDLRGRKAQFLFECLLEDLNVAVFAKDQRHHQPIIPSANLAVCSSITVKSL